MKLFFAYTLRDHRVNTQVLEEISAYFTPYFDVFIDLLDNHAEDKQRRVLEALIESDAVIVIETEKTYTSEWVRLEVEIAQKLGKKLETITLLNLQNCMRSGTSMSDFPFKTLNIPLKTAS